MRPPKPEDLVEIWYFEQYRKESDGEWRIARLELRRIRVEVDGEQAFPRG